MDNIQGLLKNQGKMLIQKVNTMSLMYYYIMVVCGIFIIWFFTYFEFQFGISVFFAMVVMLSLSKINVVASIIFALIYVYIIYNLFQDRKKILGDVIEETNMEKNGKPFVASDESVQILSKNLGKSGDSNNFSYSFWLYINSVPVKPNNKDYKNTWLNYRYGDWKSVFYRGNDMSTSVNEKSVSMKQQFPGVWLGPTKNMMSIVFQNGEDGQNVERLDIEDVPLNKWFQTSIVVEGNSVSLYINGKMENIIVLNQVIPSDIQEKDIFICKDSFLNFVSSKEDVSTEYRCPSGCIDNDDISGVDGTKSGFAGFIGEMVYYPYILTNEDIQKNYDLYKRVIDSYQKSIFPQNVSFPPLITSKSKTLQTYSKPELS